MFWPSYYLNRDGLVALDGEVEGVAQRVGIGADVTGAGLDKIDESDGDSLELRSVGHLFVDIILEGYSRRLRLRPGGARWRRAGR